MRDTAANCKHFKVKDFIRKLLIVDTDTRMTVDQALEHPWMKTASSNKLTDKLKENLVKNFHAKRKLRVSNLFSGNSPPRLTRLFPLKGGVEAVMAVNGLVTNQKKGSTQP
jgi:serine/threonine protein kinase